MWGCRGFKKVSLNTQKRGSKTYNRGKWNFRVINHVTLWTFKIILFVAQHLKIQRRKERLYKCIKALKLRKEIKKFLRRNETRYSSQLLKVLQWNKSVNDFINFHNEALKETYLNKIPKCFMCTLVLVPRSMLQCWRQNENKISLVILFKQQQGEWFNYLRFHIT